MNSATPCCAAYFLPRMTPSIRWQRSSLLYDGMIVTFLSVGSAPTPEFLMPLPVPEPAREIRPGPIACWQLSALREKTNLMTQQRPLWETSKKLSQRLNSTAPSARKLLCPFEKMECPGCQDHIHSLGSRRQSQHPPGKGRAVTNGCRDVSV